MTNSATVNAQDARRTLMTEEKISRLIPKMALPTVLAMIISSVYNMADTFFVHYLGTAATAAVGVNSSLDSIIMMAGSFLAIGANSYIARLLGAGKDKKANEVLSTAFFTAIITGLIVMVSGLSCMSPLVEFLGATPTSKQYSMDYAQYVLIAAPFMTASFVMNQCLRSEGNALFSMIGMSFGGILNIALDPLFIFTLDMGVAGAALATAISKFISFTILLMPYLRRRTLLKLSVKNIHYTKDIITEVTKMGAPSTMRTILTIISSIWMNNLAGDFSDSVLAAISVVNRIMMFPTFAIVGFGSGVQPVIGYNWGAKRYDRVRESYKFSCKLGLVVIIAVSALMGVFSGMLISLFSENDASLIYIGRICLVAQCIAMPFHGWGVIVNSMYAGLGKAGGATLMSISRQGIFFIPLLIILPILFNEIGLAVVQASADMLTLTLAIPLVVKLNKELDEKIASMPALEA